MCLYKFLYGAFFVWVILGSYYFFVGFFVLFFIVGRKGYLEKVVGWFLKVGDSSWIKIGIDFILFLK